MRARQGLADARHAPEPGLSVHGQGQQVGLCVSSFARRPQSRTDVLGDRCQYKMGFDASVRRSKQSTLPIMDIEELVESMKEKHVRVACWLVGPDAKLIVIISQICPFFKTRSIVADAEIVFVPYNYLIDPMARRSIGISLENAVLIFDEAHNVESIASEAASYALTSADITGCVSEVDQFIKALSDHQIVLGPGSSLNVEVLVDNFVFRYLPILNHLLMCSLLKR